MAYTRRDSQETENKGSVGGVGATRTQPNPQDLSSNAYLGKLVWEVNPNHTLRLTYDHLDSKMDGDALSSRSSTVLAVTAHDETQRDRVSGDWRFQDFAGLSEGSVSVYWQDSTTRQYTFEDRATLADRVRDVTFDNTVYGLAAQGSRVFGQGAAVQHRVTLGGDWSMTTQEGVRDGVVRRSARPSPSAPSPRPNTSWPACSCRTRSNCWMARSASSRPSVTTGTICRPRSTPGSPPPPRVRATTTFRQSWASSIGQVSIWASSPTTPWASARRRRCR